MKIKHFYIVEEIVTDAKGVPVSDMEGSTYVRPHSHPIFWDENGKPREFISPMAINQVVIDAGNSIKDFDFPGPFRIIEVFHFTKD